jgi:hypothetical protein
MGINVRKKILIGEKAFCFCENCRLAYDENFKFCTQCGNKLVKKSSKIYANIGKKGITSISYKTADGITINSKGNTTISLGAGVSYTVTSKNK